MKKNNFQKMLAWLTQVLTCPVCDSSYSSENTKIIEGKSQGRLDEASLVVHSDCPNCKSSVVFTAGMIGQEIFSLGMISDLTAIDAVKFRQAKPISLDEVMSLHNFIAKFDGNFERLFA